MNLKEQIKLHLEKKPTQIAGLVALALETVHKDDVLLSVRYNEPLGCVHCGREEEVAAHTSQAKGHTDVVLICPQCLDKVDWNRILKLADMEQLNSLFIWEVNHEITMLDNELRSEVLQWEG